MQPSHYIALMTNTTINFVSINPEADIPLNLSLGQDEFILLTPQRAQDGSLDAINVYFSRVTEHDASHVLMEAGITLHDSLEAEADAQAQAKTVEDPLEAFRQYIAQAFDRIQQEAGL